MYKIIKGRQIVEDDATLLHLNKDGGFLALPETGRVIVPLKQWQEQRDLLIRRGDFGVWLASNQDPQEIANDLKHFALIALDFPLFTDGRSYTNACLLRERFGWKGELRAIGDIFKDVILFQQRCGFDAFAVRADKDIHQALKALDEFSFYYQGSTIQPLPLFRLRAEK